MEKVTHVFVNEACLLIVLEIRNIDFAEEEKNVIFLKQNGTVESFAYKSTIDSNLSLKSTSM